MPAQILVVAASSGGGHVRAAQAVELALRELAPDAFVQNIDVLQHASGLFKRVYGKTYFSAIAKAPHLMAYMYDRLDRPHAPPTAVEKARGAIRNLNLKPYLALLRSRPWDVVIHTHFLSADAMSAERRRGRLHVRQLVVTTDFDPHRLWVNLPAERFFVATDEGKVNLASAGVSADAITVSGIPIHPVFATARDRARCRASLEIGESRPLVAINASGLNVAAAEAVYRGLLSIESPLEILAITGRSPQTKNRLEGIDVPPHHRACVLGFTDQMDVIMAAADLIVTKPGGLTSSECLARGLPMALVDPIPGQETRNADYLIENGAAMKINNYASLGFKVQALLGDAARLGRMRVAARRIARPRAAYDIAKVALDSIR